MTVEEFEKLVDACCEAYDYWREAAFSHLTDFPMNEPKAKAEYDDAKAALLDAFREQQSVIDNYRARDVDPYR